jgi:hypothetical protein
MLSPRGKCHDLLEIKIWKTKPGLRKKYNDICIENIFTTMIRNYPADNTAKLFKVTTLIYNN